MPFAHIQYVGKDTTDEQKAALISGVTEVISRVLKKDPARTYVVLQEVDASNWGSGGQQVSKRK